MLDLPTPPPWMDDALCTQTGPDDRTWFPHSGPASYLARATCRACPVINECLEHALDLEGDVAARDRFGIWGNTSPTQRAKIARQRREVA